MEKEKKKSVNMRVADQWYTGGHVTVSEWVHFICEMPSPSCTQRRTKVSQKSRMVLPPLHKKREDSAISGRSFPLPQKKKERKKDTHVRCMRKGKSARCPPPFFSFFFIMQPTASRCRWSTKREVVTRGQLPIFHGRAARWKAIFFLPFFLLLFLRLITVVPLSAWL